MHRLDEAAGDRKTESRSRADLVAFFHATELVEDVLQLCGWNAIALVQDLQTDRIAVAPAEILAGALY